MDRVPPLTRILLVALLVPAAALASDDSWQLGLRAFNENDYESALVFFESARDEGQRGPAVHYNIAVCQYKLEQLHDSRRTFELIANQYPKMRGLAEYNLGLIATKLGDADAARQHFRDSYAHSEGNANLRVLSTTMFAETEPATEPLTDWYGAVGFRAGFDDNVVLRDDLGLPAGTTSESPMADLYGSLDVPFLDSGHLWLHGDLYAIRYLDIDEFDQNSVRVGATYDRRYGAWRARAGVFASYGTLGGDGFDKNGSLSVRLDRRLSETSTLGVRYRYDDVSAAESIFDGIDGSRQRFDIRYRWNAGARSFVANARIETNDRADPGVSPDRMSLGFDYRFAPASGFGYEAGAEFRSSDYDDLDPSRSEDLLTLRAAITRMLNEDWQVLAEILYADNDSSDSIFAYDRNRLTIAVLRTF